ncbi:MAG: flagellar hook-associated protein FlgK [Hyphomonadaceae bacterium]|nr:flagellar hook-associated protein FlgK [Hyphomonadaceae bacterium]
MSSSLTAIMNTGLSALRASQAGLGVAAQNISNANTPGYVRAEIQFTPMTEVGLGGGVRVGEILRAADRFLAAAGLSAEATRGATTARTTILARAQAAFGDPTTDTSLFAALDRVWAAFTETSVDPSSTLGRDAAINSLNGFYAEVRRAATEVQSLIAEADERIGSAVAQAQDYLSRIAEYNQQVRMTVASGGEKAAVQNAQSVVIDQLAQMLDIRVYPMTDGTVQIRTSGGALLVGETATELSYTSTSAQFATHGVITYDSSAGSATNLEPYFTSGEIKGLIEVRDKDLKGLAEALGGLAASVGDALNAAHNENASFPAVSSLTGRQTGLLATDALNFDGKAIIGITDSDGILRQRLQIDFDAGTITGESPPGTFTFAGSTIGDMVASLNAALQAATPSGQASFTNGRLSVSANGGAGVVIQQDPTTPSDRAGRGFSHFFGLNDLVQRETPLFFETGGSAGDTHGLTGNLSFQVRDNNGNLAGNVTFAATGTSWSDLVTALNDVSTGLGRYATFAYNATTGQIGWTPNNGFSQVALTGDTTQRGGTGVSFSSLFGVGNYAGAARAIETDVATAILNDPSRLAVGRPNLQAAIGQPIVEAGDNRGVNALVAARDQVRSFSAAGPMTPQTTSLATYAARLAGVVGRMASDAQRAQEGADALAKAAADRRAQVEGVSIDDELVRMTTYQNAYAAASRLIQAASEMLRVLLQIGTTTG